MKVTDTEIALFFLISKQTLYNWKKSDEKELNMRYFAFKDFYIEHCIKVFREK